MRVPREGAANRSVVLSGVECRGNETRLGDCGRSSTVTAQCNIVGARCGKVVHACSGNVQ
jgi:hypothetical protein